MRARKLGILLAGTGGTGKVALLVTITSPTLLRVQWVGARATACQALE